MSRATAAIVVFFLAISNCCVHAGVVYDSITDQYYNGTGSVANHFEVGQAISLAGTARKITKVELQVGGNVDADFQVRFYLLDGPPWGAPNTPGTLVWESPVQFFDWTPPYYNRRVIELDVPSVVVPDTFAWAVARPIPTQALGVFGGTPNAFVGEAGGEWHRIDYGSGPQWFSSANRVMGARFTAVPEASSAILLLIGASAVFCIARQVR